MKFLLRKALEKVEISIEMAKKDEDDSMAYQLSRAAQELKIALGILNARLTEDES